MANHHRCCAFLFVTILHHKERTPPQTHAHHARVMSTSIHSATIYNDYIYTIYIHIHEERQYHRDVNQHPLSSGNKLKSKYIVSSFVLSLLYILSCVYSLDCHRVKCVVLYRVIYSAFVWCAKQSSCILILGMYVPLQRFTKSSSPHFLLWFSLSGCSLISWHGVLLMVVV